MTRPRTMAVHSTLTDGVSTITIDRQHRRNALNLEALVELDDALAGARDAGARAIVLTGAGGHFCAGADLTELEDLTFTNHLRETLDQLAELPVPTLAAISGACMGLGMQLALACDVRMCTDDASFAVPVAKLGLMVDHPTLRRLALVAGWGTARLMVLYAQVIGAEEARACGLVQRSGDLDDALALAAQVTPLAPLSLGGSKLGFNLLERSDLDPAEVGRRYREAFEAAWASEDLVEGRAAFAQRRTPRFAGS